MSNLSIYDNIFISCFKINQANLSSCKYRDVPQWDSVGHMAMISELETAFNIMMEIDDIIDFSSYEKGKSILLKYSIDV